MIVAHLDRENFESHIITEQNLHLLKEALWIDLLTPSKNEEYLVEQTLGLDIPTREEMAKLELSHRLYKENNVAFMTASIISHSDTTEPLLDPVSFVLTESQLITVRYEDPKIFSFFVDQQIKTTNQQREASKLLVELLEAHINRLSDILELISRNLDDYSKTIFKPYHHNTKGPNYLAHMQQIGLNGNMNTKALESLLALHRLVPYFQQTAASRLTQDSQSRLATLLADIIALSEHSNFMANKITFLLDATLGMIYIQQNNIIKIFSIAAVIFLPPTLVSSIYGMNFNIISELSWKYGYLYALIIMLFVSWIPYQYFKRRKWL